MCSFFQNDIPYRRRCPNRLHFNIDAKYPEYPCASPSVAKCGKKPKRERAPSGNSTIVSYIKKLLVERFFIRIH